MWTTFSITLLRWSAQFAANDPILQEISTFFSFPWGSYSPCSNCGWWEFSRLKIHVPILSHTCTACAWWSLIKSPHSEASGCSRRIVAGELATEEVSTYPRHRRRCFCRAGHGRWDFAPFWTPISWRSSRRNLTGAQSWSLCSPSQLPSCFLTLFCLLVNDELWCS